MSTTSPYIIETTSQTFEQDVVARSGEVPVVVDFWASWCQPCRMLAPVLERLANEYAGRFVLVKADTERLPDIAAAFGVRSIPAVFGLRDGRVVDSFVGVLPESAIRAFLDGLMPTPAETLVAEARKVASSDPGAAEAKYRRALELEPNLAPAKIGLARLLMSRGRAEESRSLIEDLERRGYLEPEAEAMKAELALRRGAEAVGSVESARAALAADPDNKELRFQLAEALAAAGEYVEALEISLDLVERDRWGIGESARKLMLNIFQLLPPDSEVVHEYRRRLSFVL
ncbi:MAG: tetratricopeptide repeat protein [Isosphaeraceae bacterium]|nr:tetratricopeptide repeat protein [Isosphaeraceae bacterium]